MTEYAVKERVRAMFGLPSGNECSVKAAVLRRIAADGKGRSALAAAQARG
jgi:hypothetical protein